MALSYCLRCVCDVFLIKGYVLLDNGHKVFLIGRLEWSMNKLLMGVCWLQLPSFPDILEGASGELRLIFGYSCEMTESIEHGPYWGIFRGINGKALLADLYTSAMGNYSISRIELAKTCFITKLINT